MQSGYGDEYEDKLPLELKLHWGIIRENRDPWKIGRVRVYVAGITEKEGPWALPAGMPGSGKSTQGSYRVPRIGATVLVGFIMGDIDFPFYIAGPFQQGSGAPPRRIQRATANEAPSIQVLAETESFEVYIVDLPTEKKFVVASLEEDPAQNGGSAGAKNLIEMDLVDGSIRLKASNYLILEGALVNVGGVKMQIGSRIVLPVGAPI